jgi:hypothetical protein
VPAHWDRINNKPRHRGMGGGKAGWDRNEWIPLCADCHDLCDRRAGVSEKVDVARGFALQTIQRRLGGH